MFSKKHYEEIARTINLLWGEDEFGYDIRQTVAQRFAVELLTSNPKFNAEKFLKACYAEKKEPVI